MAQARPGPPIVAISGRLGSVSFRQKSTKAGLTPPEDLPANAYEPDGKARTSVVTLRNRRRSHATPGQVAAADQARRAAAAWRALSEADRQEWIDVAAALQLTDNPESLGELSGWAMFSANRRRFLLTGEPAPDVPQFFGNPRIDRPWVKGWAGPTPGQISLFNDPITPPFPEPGSVACVYASPPRPATRSGKTRREVFVGWFDPREFFDPTDPLIFNVPEWGDAPPGYVIDVRAVTAGFCGQTSNLNLTQLRTPPAGKVLAFIAWTSSIFGFAQGIELGADRILRVWSFDYPSGAPSMLDLLNPSPKTIGQVKAFIAGEFGWEVHTIDASHDSAPASGIPAIPRKSQRFRAGALPFFAAV